GGAAVRPGYLPQPHRGFLALEGDAVARLHRLRRGRGLGTRRPLWGLLLRSTPAHSGHRFTSIRLDIAHSIQPRERSGASSAGPGLPAAHGSIARWRTDCTFGGRGAGLVSQATT